MNHHFCQKNCALNHDANLLERFFVAYVGLAVLHGLVHGGHVSNKRLSERIQAIITWQ